MVAKSRATVIRCSSTPTRTHIARGPAPDESPLRTADGLRPRSRRSPLSPTCRRGRDHAGLASIGAGPDRRGKGGSRGGSGSDPPAWARDAHLGIATFNLAAGVGTPLTSRREGAMRSPESHIANTIVGRTDYALSPIPTTLPHIRAGELLPLGVSSALALSALPDVPTVAEAGVPVSTSRSGTGYGRRPPLKPDASRSSPRTSRALWLIPLARVAPETRWRTDQHAPAARLHTVSCCVRAKALPGSSKPPDPNRRSSPTSNVAQAVAWRMEVFGEVQSENTATKSMQAYS